MALWYWKSAHNILEAVDIPYRQRVGRGCWNPLHSGFSFFPRYRWVRFIFTHCARSTCESQYFGEPLWPRGSVLGRRPPGLEFQILCLEDSVISIISPSSGGSPGPVWPICAQRCTFSFTKKKKSVGSYVHTASLGRRNGLISALVITSSPSL